MWRHYTTSFFLQAPDISQDADKKDPTRVTAERCAYLTIVALANRLDEVWISKNPILLFTYLLHYCPNIGLWSAKLFCIVM